MWVNIEWAFRVGKYREQIGITMFILLKALFWIYIQTFTRTIREIRKIKSELSLRSFFKKQKNLTPSKAGCLMWHRDTSRLLWLFFKKRNGSEVLFIKKRLQYRCFLVNIAKFLRIPILKNICERLLFQMGIHGCCNYKSFHSRTPALNGWLLL